ncbi:MAG: GldG family protein [Victivallaceae bacterium]|nr:GldG family protein [Victivallaceae bacterium]
MFKKVISNCFFNCKTIMFLMAGIFLFEFAGYWTHSLNLLFGFTLLAVVTVFQLRSYGRGTSGIKTLIGVILGIGSLIAIPGATIPIRAALLALYAIALAMFNGKQKTQNRDLLALAVAAIFSSFILTIYLAPEAALFWPGGGIIIWDLTREISFSLTSFAGLITGQSFVAGPTFSGLFITTFIIAYIAVVSDFFRVKQSKAWLRTAALIISAQLLYLIIFATMPVFIKFFSPDAKSIPTAKTTIGWIWNHYPLFMPLVLIIMCALILGFFAPKTEEVRKQAHASHIIRAVLIFILAGAGSFIINTTFPSAPDKKKIIFYEKGFLNWDRPNYKSFGNYSGGMFGNLPFFAESLGMQAKITPELNRATLQNGDILMMMNVDAALTADEIRSIHEFVNAGGALLLIGDHTQMSGDGKNWMNELLKPSKIRYKFDSADFFIGGWQYSIHFMRHPVTLGMDDIYNQFGIVVGASLAVEYPAVPLVIGRYGYSDPGEKSKGGNNGYLGNLDYDPGEELGDVVLVAAQDFGKGKIMVFGDTSSFANPLLFNTYDFANNVLTWLRQSETGVLSKWWTALGIMLFSAALLILLIGELYMLKIVAAASALLIFSCISDRIMLSKQSIIPAGNVAYIDNSHFENFKYDGWKDFGNTGLIYNVMRAGYNTFSMNSFSAEKLNLADLFIIANPTKTFSEKEIADIRGFVENGGKLLISAGWEERESLVELLAVFDITIENQPLGGTDKALITILENEVYATLLEAWPVKCGSEHKVIASWLGQPVIIARSFGKGNVYVVGDAQFLTNRMLEHENHGHLKAIIFFRWLLYNMRGETPPPLNIQGRAVNHE